MLSMWKKKSLWLNSLFVRFHYRRGDISRSDAAPANSVSKKLLAASDASQRVQRRSWKDQQGCRCRAACFSIWIVHPGMHMQCIRLHACTMEVFEVSRTSERPLPFVRMRTRNWAGRCKDKTKKQQQQRKVLANEQWFLNTRPYCSTNLKFSMIS